MLIIPYTPVLSSELSGMDLFQRMEIRKQQRLKDFSVIGDTATRDVLFAHLGSHRCPLKVHQHSDTFYSFLDEFISSSSDGFDHPAVKQRLKEQGTVRVVYGPAFVSGGDLPQFRISKHPSRTGVYLATTPDWRGVDPVLLAYHTTRILDQVIDGLVMVSTPVGSHWSFLDGTNGWTSSKAYLNRNSGNYIYMLTRQCGDPAKVRQGEGIGFPAAPINPLRFREGPIAVVPQPTCCGMSILLGVDDAIMTADIQDTWKLICARAGRDTISAICPEGSVMDQLCSDPLTGFELVSAYPDLKANVYFAHLTQ